jgi:hypothetical protein
MTYSLDSFEPTHLRCDQCGHGFPVAVPPDLDPADLRCLTAEEVALVLPQLAADVQRHEYTCLRAWFPVETWEDLGAER